MYQHAQQRVTCLSTLVLRTDSEGMNAPRLYGVSAFQVRPKTPSVTNVVLLPVPIPPLHICPYLIFAPPTSFFPGSEALDRKEDHGEAVYEGCRSIGWR